MTMLGGGTGLYAGPQGIPSVTIRASGLGNATDANAINAAIAAADGPLRIYLPDPLYYLATQIVVDKHSIWIEGAGSPVNPAGEYTWLYVPNTYSGDGPVILWDLGTGSDATRVISGGGLSNVYLQDGSGISDLDGIGIVCARNLYLHDFAVQSFLGRGITTQAAAGNGVYSSSVSVRMERFQVITTTGTAISLDGIYASSFSDFSWTVTGAGVGLDVRDTDDLWFNAWGGVCNDAAGIHVRLQGDDYGGTVGNARAHVFTGGVIGGSSKTIQSLADGLDKTARRNLFLGLSTEDGEVEWDAEAGGAPYFVDVDGKHNLRPHGRRTAIVQDDFIAGPQASPGELRWYVGGGVGVTLRTPEANHPGIVRLTTSASSGTLAFLALRGDDFRGSILPSDTWELEYVIRLNTNDTDTLVRFGLASAFNANPPSDGIYFEKLAADTSWYGVCRGSSSETRSSALESVDTSWHRFRIRRHNNGTIAFDIGTSINDGSDARIINTIPTAGLQPFIQIRNAAAADKTMDIDWFQLHLTGLERW